MSDEHSGELRVRALGDAAVTIHLECSCGWRASWLAPTEYRDVSTAWWKHRLEAIGRVSTKDLVREAGL